MNKKDFLTLIIFDFVALIMLIEHWCGLELALSFMCVWTAVSMLVHILVLKDYIFTITIKEE
jgi:hypothetical protein